MKTLGTTLLTLAALSSLGRGQITLVGEAFLGRSDTYNATMIGTALGPAVRRTFPSPQHPSSVDEFAVQSVRVNESRAFRPGTVVDVCLPYWDHDRVLSPDRSTKPVDQTGALPVGRPALIVAIASPQAGTLRAPIGNTDAIQDLRFDPSTFPTPMVAAYAFFDTRQAKLAPVADPVWRLLGSVADALRGTDDANARKVEEFLEGVRLPEWSSSADGPRADDRLSALFSDAASAGSAYHRALVDYALNKLCYLGYGDRYRRDVFAAATDPNAFPTGVSDPEYWEQPQNDGRIPKGFRHDSDLSDSERVALLKAAQSPTVAAWLLKELRRPGDADVRSLARFLDSPDRDLRWTFVERLATWNGVAPPEKPKQIVEPTGAAFHWEYPGLDEAVAFWKRKLATP